MAYVTPNFKSKAAMKRAVLAGETVRVFSNSAFVKDADIQNGLVHIEGPHFPEPHKFYTNVEVKDGKVVAVK